MDPGQGAADAQLLEVHRRVALHVLDPLVQVAADLLAGLDVLGLQLEGEELPVALQGPGDGERALRPLVGAPEAAGLDADGLGERLPDLRDRGGQQLRVRPQPVGPPELTADPLAQLVEMKDDVVEPLAPGRAGRQVADHGVQVGCDRGLRGGHGNLRISVALRWTRFRGTIPAGLQGWQGASPASEGSRAPRTSESGVRPARALTPGGRSPPREMGGFCPCGSRPSGLAWWGVGSPNPSGRGRAADLTLADRGAAAAHANRRSPTRSLCLVNARSRPPPPDPAPVRPGCAPGAEPGR